MFRLPKCDRNIAEQKFANYTMKSLRFIIISTQLLVASPGQIVCARPAVLSKNWGLDTFTMKTGGKFVYGGQ